MPLLELINRFLYAITHLLSMGAVLFLCYLKADWSNARSTIPPRRARLLTAFLTAGSLFCWILFGWLTLVIEETYEWLPKRARAGDTREVAWELRQGADPNMRSGDWTVLMIAADAGRLETVQLLLDSGANPGHVNDKGDTALDLARKRLLEGVRHPEYSYGSPTANDREALRRIVQVLEARYL